MNEHTGNGKISDTIGINGAGRIGKLVTWFIAGRRKVDKIVINIGRKVSNPAHYFSKDSTYGDFGRFFFGCDSKIKPEMKTDNSFMLNGVEVILLTRERNPGKIPWGEYGVKFVIDTTGEFKDPNMPMDTAKGSVRGHFFNGVEKVMISAPFKLKGKDKMPDDSITLMAGIKNDSYDQSKHRIVSSASCTTTALVYTLLPIINHFGVNTIESIKMDTIHAATGSQSVLDRAPKDDLKNPRKKRSIINNMIMTTTGAAKALKVVLPELEPIQFATLSLRVPTNTASLVSLNINLTETFPDLDETFINQLYEAFAKTDQGRYMDISYDPNVSVDMIGSFNAVTIEGLETKVLNKKQLVIMGWYDNEMGYTRMMLELAKEIVRGR